MKTCLATLALLVACASTLFAQNLKAAREPRREELRRNEARRDESHSDEPQTMTPEMWFYKQELNRHDDPQTSVRRKAEMRAAQRQYRIESRKWYGLSNARPTVSYSPQYGTYSPAWTAPDQDPNRYRAASGAYITTRLR